MREQGIEGFWGKNATFGERLEAALSRTGMSQAQFASKIGRSKRSIGNMIRNESSPSAIVIGKIAQNLNVSTDWLIFGSGGGTETYHRGSNQSVKNVPILQISEIMDGLQDDPRVYRATLDAFSENPHGHEVIPISYKTKWGPGGLPDFFMQSMVDWFTDIPLHSMIGFSTKVAPAVGTFCFFAIKRKTDTRWHHGTGYWFPNNFRAVPSLSIESYEKSWKDGFKLCGDQYGKPSIHDLEFDLQSGDEITHLGSMVYLGQWTSTTLADRHWGSRELLGEMWESRRKPGAWLDRPPGRQNKMNKR
jgi:transcriptional regulator with XRE-family HTH domain